MSKWNVSEQSIYDENSQLIIEASEWYMRENLQKICDEHNSNETFKDVEEIADYLIEFASDAFEHKDREELIKALKHYGKWS